VFSQFHAWAVAGVFADLFLELAQSSVLLSACGG
jgi:hypothetical protein